jgi:cytochrome c oxidase subunit II
MTGRRRSGWRRATGVGARAASALAALGVSAACTGYQHALDPRGPQAARIADLFWLSLILGVIAFFGYMAVLAYALHRARRIARRGEENRLPTRHGRNLVLIGGVALPLVILLVHLLASVYTDRRLALLVDESDSDLLEIEVIGHQFWWQVRYLDHANAYRTFTTANEIHIPVGRPVRVILESRDVIHSFWVPNLHGKIDMIPGRTNYLDLQADEAGVFRGQCAEFCGAQHAKMAFLVVAVDSAEFEAWWDDQIVPPPEPVDETLRFGQQVFMQNGCGLCHRVSGTLALGTYGPDLTRIGSRRTIAAGWLPNTRGHLSGWITDPQGVKPGNLMPPISLDGESLHALVSYLQSLR